MAQPTYLGCYIEDVLRPDLGGEPPLIITRAEACFAHCSTGTWSYAAIRNRTVCTCGDNYSKYGTAPATACSTYCPEEQSAYDYCGGPEANSVYLVGSSKTPIATPSIRPPVYPVPPGHPSGDNNDNPASRGHDQDKVSHGTSSNAAVISSTVVVAVVVLAIMSLMVYRRRRSNSNSNSNGSEGNINSFLDLSRISMSSVRGGTNSNQKAVDRHVSEDGRRSGSKSHRRLDEGLVGYDDIFFRIGRYNSIGGSSGLGDVENQIFEGFDSSAVVEDGQEQGRRSSTDTTKSKDSKVLSPPDVQVSAPITPPPPAATTADPRTHSSLSLAATKFGSKLGDLRVKTRRNHQSSNSGSGSTLSLSIAPITPISPISPISPGPFFDNAPRSADSSNRSSRHNSINTAGSNALDNALGLSGTSDNAWSASSSLKRYPSTSSQESDRPGQGDRGRRRSSMDVNAVKDQLQQQQQQQQQFKPLPSPISPPLHYASLPPISPSSPILPLPPVASQVSYHSQDLRHQKQHQSKLINDLILQDDSILDEKEMAMMAQYQPHHRRQQRQQQQHQQELQKQQIQKQKEAQSHSATVATKPVQRTDVDLLQQLSQQHRPTSHIPAVDTNYLAPPTPTPRIRIHKAL